MKPGYCHDDQSKVSSKRHPSCQGPGPDTFFRFPRVSRPGVAAQFADRLESRAPDTAGCHPRPLIGQDPPLTPAQPHHLAAIFTEDSFGKQTTVSAVTGQGGGRL